MKQQNDRFYYELDKEIAKNLHPTPYDPRYFRLVCTIVKDNVIAWDTLCLSDYIRPSKKIIFELKVIFIQYILEQRLQT
jgi:hypothetical protein